MLPSLKTEEAIETNLHVGSTMAQNGGFGSGMGYDTGPSAISSFPQSNCMNPSPALQQTSMNYSAVSAATKGCELEQGIGTPAPKTPTKRTLMPQSRVSQAVVPNVAGTNLGKRPPREVIEDFEAVY